MPISPITLQRRHAELGRIRLGDQRPAGDSGRTRPNKLDRFRFTSVSERYIRDLAALYGGEPKPWDNGGIASWEVYSEARSVPVIVVKGGLSQWMEFWSGGGCVHRCDGQINTFTGEPCDTTEQLQVGRKTVNPHTEARPTTRLSLMLVELEAVGVWRCETHGWNAAAEIPAVAELAQFVGDLVPANLHLVERRTVKDGQTSRFVVPVLDLQIGTQRLKELVAERSGQTQPKELTGTGPAAISAPTPDYLAQAGRTNDPDAVRDLWREASAAGHMTPDLSTALQARAAELTAAAAPAPAAQQPNADGTYDADVVEPADTDALWGEVLKVGGQLGMSLGDVNDEYAAQHGGAMPDTATAAELAAFLETLRREVNAA